MRSRILASIFYFVVSNTIAFGLLYVLLPRFYLEGIDFYLAYVETFALIMSGPISAKILQHNSSSIEVAVFLIVGAIIAISWFILLRSTKASRELLAAPIVIWVIFGFFITFFTLAAGV